MVVVAGPPGSGKTTAFPLGALGIDAFNIDDRCAQYIGSYQAIPKQVRAAVARQCEQFVAEHIADGRSFAVETTLRTVAAVRQAEVARKRGFRAEMRFLATSSPEEDPSAFREVRETLPVDVAHLVLRSACPPA